MFDAIVIEVIANAIFFILTILFGWSGFLILRRRKLLRFFDIKASKSISIYLSNLKIIEGGSIDSDGNPGLYKGTTVVFNEAIQAMALQGLFNQ